MFKKKEALLADCACALQTGAAGLEGDMIGTAAALYLPEHRLFEELRRTVPIIDAGVGKIIRLMGNFTVSCQDEAAGAGLEQFLRGVPVSGTGRGMNRFLFAYLEDLLTYGGAVGEMVFFENGRAFYGLNNAPLRRILARRAADGFHVELLRIGEERAEPFQHPERLLYTALYPRDGEVMGRSLLEGLPFVSNILLKIYRATEKNFDRVGNVRFAVTYRPGEEPEGRARAAERAQAIAKEWQKAMRADAVRDFVAVGDVDIRVIGADNQVLDTAVPARQMLEQIVAKLGIPPFLLGLNWSTTERMSKAQADILTSELMSYQNVVTPVIEQVSRTWLRTNGFSDEPRVYWEPISLMDQLDGANARLLNARAKELESRWEEKYGKKANG